MPRHRQNALAQAAESHSFGPLRDEFWNVKLWKGESGMWLGTARGPRLLSGRGYHVRTCTPQPRRVLDPTVGACAWTVTMAARHLGGRRGVRRAPAYWLVNQERKGEGGRSIEGRRRTVYPGVYRSATGRFCGGGSCTAARVFFPSPRCLGKIWLLFELEIWCVYCAI
jgi:hypothetical protein